VTAVEEDNRVTLLVICGLSSLPICLQVCKNHFFVSGNRFFSNLATVLKLIEIRSSKTTIKENET
jgi:hypothetical protein